VPEPIPAAPRFMQLILNADGTFQVVGNVPSPLDALDMIARGVAVVTAQIRKQAQQKAATSICLPDGSIPGG
jgi:hypothetical protein